MCVALEETPSVVFPIKWGWICQSLRRTEIQLSLTFADQQADLRVGEFLHPVALPRHQPQHAHEGPHVADAPGLLLQLLPLRCLVDAGEDVSIGVAQGEEEGLAPGIFPNHLRQETSGWQHMSLLREVGSLCR